MVSVLIGGAGVAARHRIVLIAMIGNTQHTHVDLLGICGLVFWTFEMAADHLRSSYRYLVVRTHNIRAQYGSGSSACAGDSNAFFSRDLIAAHRRTIYLG